MIFKRYDQKSDGWPVDMPPLHWTPVTEAQHEVFGRRTGERVAAIVTCKNSHACALRIPPFTVVGGVINPSVACPVTGCDGHEAPGAVMEGWP